jgi:Cu/Ag efflux pump CusA
VEEDLLEGDFLAELKHDLVKNNMKMPNLSADTGVAKSTKIIESNVKKKPGVKKVVVTDTQPKIDLQEMGCRHWTHEILHF